VFDPFFTTKPVGKGTGLGLSQVYGFVHLAGGTVRVDSRVREGTRVTLYLPRSTDAIGETEAQERPNGHAGDGTVLLVEDNPEVASASVGLLEQLGYTVRSVTNAEAALAALEEDPAIKLVFSDIVMPGRADGLALARSIRQKRPGLPVLLATGYSNAAQGADAEFPILRKPYQLGELSGAIAKLMAKNVEPARNRGVVAFRAKRPRTPKPRRTES
jgi:CheY-like chemotaxis protein